MNYAKLKTGLVIAFTGVMLGVAPVVSRAAGDAGGYIQSDNLFFDAGKGIYFVFMNNVKPYTDYYGGISDPWENFDRTGECGGGGLAMLDLGDSTHLLRKELYFELKLATTLKYPVSIQTKGCVVFDGGNYPKIIGSYRIN